MRKLMALALTAAGIALVALGPSPAASAGATTTVTVSFSIVPAQMLTVSTDHVDFAVVSPGISTPGREVVVTVRSNTSYRLSYTATDFTDGAGRTVPVGRLSPDGGRAPFEYSGVLTEEAGPTDGTPYTHIYVLTVEPEDPGGTFSGEITYILSPY